jgi:catechol 2,3-dioxygenase-like lactoylglutathione lyase family enzyme
MALELYMVGLSTPNMDKSLEFYRRLGVSVPEQAGDQQHIGVEMKGGLTFFLNTTKLVAEADRPRLILEFYLKERLLVDAKYNEMLGFGYESYRTPFVTPQGMYFAMISDPDGNLILLSAD